MTSLLYNATIRLNKETREHHIHLSNRFPPNNLLSMNYLTKLQQLQKSQQITTKCTDGIKTSALTSRAYLDAPDLNLRRSDI